MVRQARRAAPLDGAVAKTSAGAVAHLRIATVVNVSRALEELKEAGVWTVGLAADGDAAYDAIDLTVPTVAGDPGGGEGGGDDVFGAAYEGVTFRDSADDGTEGAVLGDAPRIGVWEIGLAAGGIGLFGLALVRLLRSAPVVPLRDPQLFDSLHYD